jgi:hypothetical protein
VLFLPDLLSRTRLGAGSLRHNRNLMVSYGHAYCISSIARKLDGLLLVHGLFIGASKGRLQDLGWAGLLLGLSLQANAMAVLAVSPLFDGSTLQPSQPWKHVTETLGSQSPGRESRCIQHLIRMLKRSRSQ